jgi:hypothetical protein
MRRVKDSNLCTELLMYSLAGYRITTLPTLQIFCKPYPFLKLVRFCGEKEIRTLEAVTPSLFSRQLPRPTGLSPLCEWIDSNHLSLLNNRFTVCYNSPTLSHSHLAEEERFELSTLCLTNTCSAVELFIHFVGPVIPNAFGRTLNPRVKSSVHLNR